MKTMIATFASILVLASSPAVGDAPALLRVEVHYNFLTGAVNSWTATGAFEATGTIGTGQTVHHDVPGVSIVVGPMISKDGTFTWKFHKRYFPTDNPSVATSSGEFHIIDGTGRFDGLQGHGQVEGRVDVVTGEIVDVFTGWVLWTASPAN